MNKFIKKRNLSPEEVEETTEVYLDKIKGKLGNVYSNFLMDVKRKIDKEKEESTPLIKRKREESEDSDNVLNAPLPGFKRERTEI